MNPFTPGRDTAWQHQLAFTILAQWFVTQTRLDWEEKTAPVLADLAS